MPESEREAKRRCRAHGHCYYCGRPLHTSHQHDHVPIAKRHGGDVVVPACRECHSLKDRLLLGDLPPDVATRAVDGMDTPETRIYFLKLYQIMGDAIRDAESWRHVAEAHGATYREFADDRYPTEEA